MLNCLNCRNYVGSEVYIIHNLIKVGITGVSASAYKVVIVYSFSENNVITIIYTILD